MQVKIQENHWASLVCGRSKTRIAGMSRESFPELPQMPEVLAEIPIGVLASMIGKTIFAISREESRFTLNGALLVLKSKAGCSMVATDGHRLAMVEHPAELPGISSAVSRAAAAQGDGGASEAGPGVERGCDPSQFSGDDNHLFFQLGERLLLSRKLTGNFPDYERVLPKDQPHFVTLDREELRSAIERVAQFSDERSRADSGARRRKARCKIHSSVVGNRRERREHSGRL